MKDPGVPQGEQPGESSSLVTVTRNSFAGRAELRGKKSSLQRETFDRKII